MRAPRARRLRKDTLRTIMEPSPTAIIVHLNHVRGGLGRIVKADPAASVAQFGAVFGITPALLVVYCDGHEVDKSVPIGSVAVGTCYALALVRACACEVLALPLAHHAPPQRSVACGDGYACAHVYGPSCAGTGAALHMLEAETSPASIPPPPPLCPEFRELYRRWYGAAWPRASRVVRVPCAGPSLPDKCTARTHTCRGRHTLVWCALQARSKPCNRGICGDGDGDSGARKRWWFAGLLHGPTRTCALCTSQALTRVLQCPPGFTYACTKQMRTLPDGRVKAVAVPGAEVMKSVFRRYPGSDRASTRARQVALVVMATAAADPAAARVLFVAGCMKIAIANVRVRRRGWVLSSP